MTSGAAPDFRSGQCASRQDPGIHAAAASAFGQFLKRCALGVRGSPRWNTSSQRRPLGTQTTRLQPSAHAAIATCCGFVWIACDRG